MDIQTEFASDWAFPIFATNSSHATAPSITEPTPAAAAAELSLMECNHQPYDWFSYVIRVLLMVPVLIFGLAANAMNVLIFRHERMRSSMVNWYLVALAVTDVGVLFSSFSMLSLPVICEDFDSLTLFNLGVYAQRWTYALGLTMQTASVGMTVLVSAHRFLGVVFPFRAQQWCTAKRVKVAMWSVAIFAISFNVPRWFEIDVDACQSSVYNATATSLVLSNLRLDNSYYSAYMVILYTLFMFALPFLLLIIMNALIVRTVHRSYRLRQMLTNKVSNTGLVHYDSQRRRPSQPQKAQGAVSPQHQQQQYERAQADAGIANSNTGSLKENKTTIMLIAVVFMFLLCNSLAFINNILEVLAAHGVPVWQAYLTTVELSNFLVVINSSSNIFIYWTFSARYRLLFRRYIYYFCFCCSPCSSLCSQMPRRHHTTNTRLNDAAAAANEAQSGPNRLLMIRKNNRYDEAVSPCVVGPATANVARIRRESQQANGAAVAAINRHEPFREPKLEPKSSRRPAGTARFRQSQHQELQPQESPLLDNASPSDTDAQSKHQSIVSSV